MEQDKAKNQKLNDELEALRKKREAALSAIEKIEGEENAIAKRMGDASTDDMMSDFRRWQQAEVDEMVRELEAKIGENPTVDQFVKQYIEELFAAWSKSAGLRADEIAMNLKRDNDSYQDWLNLRARRMQDAEDDYRDQETELRHAIASGKVIQLSQPVRRSLWQRLKEVFTG